MFRLLTFPFRLPGVTQIIVLLLVWYLFVGPLLNNTYNRLVAYYWWMQPW
jgi:hypothetical protein